MSVVGYNSQVIRSSLGDRWVVVGTDNVFPSQSGGEARTSGGRDSI